MIFSILLLLIFNIILLVLSAVAGLTPFVICSIISFVPIFGLIVLSVNGKI